MATTRSIIKHTLHFLLLAAVFLSSGCYYRDRGSHLDKADAPSIQDAPVGSTPIAVPVGKGSYASVPPPEAGQKALDMLTEPLYIINPNNRPIPTNQWWTDMLVHNFGGQLWAFPQMVKASRRGIDIFFPVQWNQSGRDPISDHPISIRPANFLPDDCRVKAWGDWTLTFRMAQGDSDSDSPFPGGERGGGRGVGSYMDVTLGRGMPFVWCEFGGVAPVVAMSDSAQYFDDHGNPITFPYAGDHFGVLCAGRAYGVFAPDNTRFTGDDRQVAVEFAGPKRFLVVSPLPSKSDLATFHRFAYAIPRDSKMNWTYDPDKAFVMTSWHITTEPLKGTERRVIQGWLPHHYRGTDCEIPMNGMQYLTPRGTMKCAVGTDFKIGFPFNGILPFYPPPHTLGLPHDFDIGRMRGYVDKYATRTKYGDDTYWGGKDLTQLADYMALAHEIGDNSSSDALRHSLYTALTDWYTYTPGEKAHYFARYPNWHALIGFKSSYGSEAFNDNHFHYGYFTRATALLGLFDPQFLAGYGGMAKLVAKQYANWDRTDSSFPFLRCFDIWEGHSWASGTSSPTGDNQESSSEAVQSWAGLFLLGTALHDKAMTAAGAMGYSMETRAALEYWFDIHHDNHSPNFAHPIAGMVWSGGILYGNYFSGDPAWTFGIQWLPMSPAMIYLVKDPDYAKQSFHDMMTARAAKEGTADIGAMGTGLGNVVLSEAQQVDPDWTAEQLDDLWDANSPVAHDNDTPGLTYYMTHANRMLGQVQWNYHTSVPTSTVYFDPRTQTYHYVVYNPDDEAVDVSVYKGNAKIGTMQAAPHEVTVADKLDGG